MVELDRFQLDLQGTFKKAVDLETKHVIQDTCSTPQREEKIRVLLLDR